MEIGSKLSDQLQSFFLIFLIKKKERNFGSGSPPRFGFQFLFSFLIQLRFLFLLFFLHLVFSLQVFDFLVRFCNRFKETFEARLLRGFQILGQSCRCASHSVFAEAFLGHEELDQAFNVRSFPFEVAVRVLWWSHVWVEKQLSRVLVGPVVRDGVAFLRVFLDERYDVLEAAVVADHFEGAVRSDFRDGVDVVASKEDAEINELF